MKSFRTIIDPEAYEKNISLKDNIFTIGSCFADAIGSRLINYKFPTMVNPFGVIYNPHSIHKLLRYAISNEKISEHTFIQNQDIFYNYDFHSEFSSMDKTDLLQQLANTIHSTHAFLKEAQWLVITYGTSWAYERTDTSEVVANCHKMPAKDFSRTLLTQKKIIESFEALYVNLKTYNPGIRIILTISPVRHISDTLELNSVSKAILRTTCHTLTESFKSVDYFAAYELMIDDLRDYRFYKADMIHPTIEAEEYIWEKFADRYFNNNTKDFIAKWKNIRAALSHRPFHPASQAHQKFLHDTLHRLNEFKNTIDIHEEVKTLQQQIIKPPAVDLPPETIESPSES